MPATDADFDLRVSFHSLKSPHIFSFNFLTSSSFFPAVANSVLLLHRVSDCVNYKLVPTFSLSLFFSFQTLVCFFAKTLKCLGFLIWIFKLLLETINLPMWRTWTIVLSTWTNLLLPSDSRLLSISLAMIRCVFAFSAFVVM